MIGNTLAVLTFLHGADLATIWEIKEKKEKRSLNQNSYYWVLLGKVADALRNSKTVQHNLILRDYGQRLIINNNLVRVVLPDTEEAEETVLNAETYHVKPTSQVIEGMDGKPYRTYVMMRGSHDYNTEEMSILLDGLIAEAKQLGIETLTPQELEQMRAYEQKN